MKTFLSALVLIGLFSASAFGDDGGKALVKPQVEYVWSGGDWNQGDRHGGYRFIVTGGGFDHHFNRLYIQWTEFDTTKGETIVRASVRIKELENAAGYAFDIPKCNSLKYCKKMTLQVTQTRTLDRLNFTISLHGVGNYTINKN